MGKIRDFFKPPATEEETFQLEVEFLPRRNIPLPVLKRFPDGAIVLLRDEEYWIGFPGTAKQRDQLEQLLAMGDTEGFNTFAEQLMGTPGLSERLQAELDRMHEADEIRERMREGDERRQMRKQEYEH